MYLPTHFLIIAVENYNEKGFPRVRYAQKDAKDVVLAYQNLGYDPAYMKILINGHATKATIETELNIISRSASDSERIVIYFAGHGFATGGKNFIAPVDARHEDPERTCIAIDHILGWLKKAASNRNLLFLDCCHSGFEPGEYIRTPTASFSNEEMILLLRDETYCIGYASCQTHETSISDPTLQNGVWSHFLVKALRGAADGIYDNGVLTSDKLQSFLRYETSQFVRKNTTDRKTQTPIQFGHLSGRFIIEDLRGVFADRDEERKASSFSLTSISLYDTEGGRVKDLENFRKGSHQEPYKINSTADNWIREISGDLVGDEIKDLCNQIQDAFDYPIGEIKVNVDPGNGTVETPDFSYKIYISQSQDNSKEFVITRRLYTIENNEIIQSDDFNNIFDNKFRKLQFQFDRKINMHEFIKRMQPIAKEKGFRLKFNPADITTCFLIFPDSGNEIVINRNSIEITIPKALPPLQLINVCKEALLMLERTELKLLN